MLIEAVNGQQLQDLVNTNGIVLIDFWAEWCAPCKEFAKTYAKVAQQYPDIHFTKVDIQTEEELADSFQIRSIPHLIVFKENIIIYSESGSMPASALTELVEQALKVDMAKL